MVYGGVEALFLPFRLPRVDALLILYADAALRAGCSSQHAGGGPGGVLCPVLAAGTWVHARSISHLWLVAHVEE